MKRRLSLVLLVVGAFLIIFSATSYSMKENKDSEVKEDNKKDDMKDVKRSSDFSYHPPMYKVCDLNSCVTLVSYTKLGDDYVLNLDNKIKEVLTKDKEVVIEANDTDIDEMEYLKNFVLASGDSLDKYLDESTITKLTKFGEEHTNYNYDKYKLYNIGFNHRSIENIMYVTAGLNKDGIIPTIINTLKENTIKYNVLENSDYDVKFINNYDSDLYKKFINDNIDNFDNKVKDIKKLYNAYLDNDIDYLNKYYSIDLDSIKDEEELRFYTDKFVTKNEIYSYEIIGLLNDDIDKVLFFNIENMFGNRGILTFLKDYKVDLIK